MRTNRFAPHCAAALFATLALLQTSGVAGAHDLPVGDGHVTRTPTVGNVFSCQTNFPRGSALRTGPWFKGDTWNPDAKPRIQGRVMWPDAKFRITPNRNEDQLAIEGNGLPLDQPTGVFPVAPDDPAREFDPNPNRITARNLSFQIPVIPVPAEKPGCLPMGMIGITTTGVAIFNALDAEGRDAVAHEVQDLCDGHPERSGQYHYHSGSSCLPGAEGNFLVGFALDGYPIFGMRDADDKVLTNEDLDACHGRREQVRAQGRLYDYAYRLTQEYPYTLGCFTGQVSQATLQAIRPAGGPPPGPKGYKGPPPKGPPPYGFGPPLRQGPPPPY